MLPVIFTAAAAVVVAVAVVVASPAPVAPIIAAATSIARAVAVAVGGIPGVVSVVIDVNAAGESGGCRDRREYTEEKKSAVG
jgi:hypothetical protein